MPRQGRINIEGGIYHVIQRGIERREIFGDDKDREEFLRRLSEGLEVTGHKCYGWVLMPNHFHLIIRIGTKPLSGLMRKIQTGYAIYFNKKYRRSGYLYQNRYKSILCQEDEYLLELVRYIHLNPVRAKIVDISNLNRYKWSGHSVIVGQNKAKWQSTGEILSYFGKRKSEAVRKYEKFVAEAKDKGRIEELSGGGLVRSAGGWKKLVRMSQSKQMQQGDERILGDGEFVNMVLKKSEEDYEKRVKYEREGYGIDRIIETVCKMTSITKEQLKKRGRGNNISRARGLISYWANKELGLSRNKIAKLINITGWSVSRLAVLGEKIARKDNLDLIKC